MRCLTAEDTATPVAPANAGAQFNDGIPAPGSALGASFAGPSGTWLAITIALLSSACAGGLRSDVPPSQAYILRAAPATPPATALPAGAPSLRVGRIQTAPGLDTDHIVLVRSDHRLDYFAGSRWAAPLPDIVDALATEFLRNSGAFRAVGDAGGFNADYSLQIQIRRFEADYTEGTVPTVHVAMDCLVSRRGDRELVSAFAAEAAVPASANRISAIVSAFEQAANAALATVSERSAAAIGSAAQK